MGVVMNTTTPVERQAIEHLQALGFSEYEGRAYLVLLQRGPLSGYQLAKASGIPRPNIYPVLDKLEARGAVSRVEVKGGVKYSARPADRLLEQLSQEVQGHASQAQHALRQLGGPLPDEHVANVQGYDAVIRRAEALVERARGKLLAGVRREEAGQLAQAFAQAERRGVDQNILCIAGCPEECGGCRGRVYRYSLAASSLVRWLILVADDQELLVAQVDSQGRATAGVTRLPVLVAMGADYLRNAIAAAEIVRSLGPRLPELVDAAALEVLQGTGLSTAAGPWFGRFVAAVGSGKT